jgi:hypothetical protein
VKNDQQRRVKEDVAVAYVEVISQYLAGMTDEK